MKHWSKNTFKETDKSDIGRYGFCTVCQADMQVFNSEGEYLHYASHRRYKQYQEDRARGYSVTIQ